MKNKILLAGFISCIYMHNVSAMPCDKGYSCTAKSGKYEINVGVCRYYNSLRLREVKRNQTLIKDATLGPAYDGTYDNGPLDFEVILPPMPDDDSSARRILTIELPAKSEKGIIKEKYVAMQPGEFKTIYQESVTCNLSG